MNNKDKVFWQAGYDVGYKTAKKELLKDINFKGIISLEDKEAREFISILETRIDTINKRTKQHTLEIRELRKEVEK